MRRKSLPRWHINLTNFSWLRAPEPARPPLRDYVLENGMVFPHGLKGEQRQTFMPSARTDLSSAREVKRFSRRI
jgi:hypothetical protein